MKLLLKFAYRLLIVYWSVLHPVTVGVRLLLAREGNVLLVRHTYRKAWYLPGGGIKRGETLEQAARREAQEECGASLGQLELLGAYTDFEEYKTDQVVLFSGNDFSLTGSSDHEIEEMAFFPFDNLPVDITPGTRRKIEAFALGSLPRSGAW
jgi:8-oxo-dGTP pyrophosphatase MutT (NUDIX family)